MKRSDFLRGAAAACLSGLLAGCQYDPVCGHKRAKAASSTDEAVLPALRIGAENFPPFHTEDADGNHIGIDVDIAREALSRMGYRPEFVYIDWDLKDTLLENGTIDCIWDCFSMKSREARYRWAGPYMVSRQVLAVNPDSSIWELRDLDDKVIAVRSTALPESLLLDGDDPRYPQNCEVYSLEDSDLLYAALNKGYVDALAAHESAVYQYMQDYGTRFRILEEPLLVTGVGVAFALDDARGLAEALNKTLTAMRQDGTMEQLLCKYYSQPEKFLEVDFLENG